MAKFNPINFITFLSVICLSCAASAIVEDVSCGENYNFDTLKFPDFYPEKAAYSQNDTVKVTYTLSNEFNAPLVQGDVKVLVMYRGTTDVDRIEDDDIIDDIIVQKGVNLQAGDKYTGSFEWKIPLYAKPGVYAMNAYFPVKKKFNIAGLTFMTSVPAATTSFEVKGGSYEQILLDKNATSFNGEKYLFRSPTPEAGPGSPVFITSKLLNPGKKNVDVTYELYKWDDLETKLDSYSKTETLSDSKDLAYPLGNLPAGVYVARITASSGDMKSILKVRFYVKGALGRFIWVGLGSFPLMNADASKIGFCLSNSAVEPGDSTVQFNVSGTITLLDEAGNKILEEKYAAPLTADISGKMINFTAGKQLTKATLKADMYDGQGNLMDSVEIPYEYAKFLNIDKKFTITAPDTVKDSLSYTVSYTDKYQDPISGKAVVYLISPSGRIVALKEDNISGNMGGVFSLAGMEDGTYTLKAVENVEHLADAKTITISSTAQEPVTTTIAQNNPTTTHAGSSAEKNPDNTLLIAAVLIIVLAALIYVLFGKKKEKK